MQRKNDVTFTLKVIVKNVEGLIALAFEIKGVLSAIFHSRRIVSDNAVLYLDILERYTDIQLLFLILWDYKTSNDAAVKVVTPFFVFIPSEKKRKQILESFAIICFLCGCILDEELQNIAGK